MVFVLMEKSPTLTNRRSDDRGIFEKYHIVGIKFTSSYLILSLLVFAEDMLDESWNA